MTQSTTIDLPESVRDCGFVVRTFPRADDEVLQVLELSVGFDELPAETREFFASVGGLEVGTVRIAAPALGPSDPRGIWHLLDEVPAEAGLVLPVESLTGGRMAVVTEEGTVRIVAADGTTKHEFASLDSYIKARVEEIVETERLQIERHNQYVRDARERLGANEQNVAQSFPRATDYRPIRYCVQDEVLGMCSFKFSRKKNAVQVGAFISADVPELSAHTGTWVLVALLLIEAYKAGGSMEIHFNAGVPEGALRVAEDHGLRLASADVITAQEATALLRAMSGVGPLLDAIEVGGIPASSSVNIAFHVLRGVWSRLEAQILLNGGAPGVRVLLGGTEPAFWLLHRSELAAGRVSVAGAALDRALRSGGLKSSEGGSPAEDVEPEIYASVDDSTPGLIWWAGEDVDVPWVVNPGQPPVRGEVGVFVRPRDAADIAAYFETDLATATAVRSPDAHSVALLYPRDFWELGQDDRSRILRAATSENVVVLVGPVPTNTLDRDVKARFKAAGGLQ